MNAEVLNFTVFCIGSLADYLKIGAKEVYHKLIDADIISGYIVPCYDTLHTFSKEYIVEDLVELMQRRGVLTK